MNELRLEKLALLTGTVSVVHPRSMQEGWLL
jgi:hypothetical protein